MKVRALIPHNLEEVEAKDYWDRFLVTVCCIFGGAFVLGLLFVLTLWAIYGTVSFLIIVVGIGSLFVLPFVSFMWKPKGRRRFLPNKRIW